MSEKEIIEEIKKLRELAEDMNCYGCGVNAVEFVNKLITKLEGEKNDRR